REFFCPEGRPDCGHKEFDQAARFSSVFHRPVEPSHHSDGGERRAMKLTRAASYAIHALVFMAAQKSTRPLASHNIAHARGIPERFLLKVLKPLVSVRLLMSIKGPNGGYRLAKPPNAITLLEILE